MPAADPLDNAVWHAATGPQAHLAEGGSLMRRFAADVAPFAAMPDAASPASWDALRACVGPGETAVLFRSDVSPPAGWEEVARMPCRQMVCRRRLDRAAAAAVAAAAGAPSAAGRIAELGAEDVPAMLEIVARTRPGPFSPRTWELGRYLGVRDGAGLAAMAGERMRIPGATEISAVCTAPEHRRRGLAAALVVELVASIQARGELPFLHVLADNAPAIRVYDALGFATRATIDVVVLRAPR